MNDQPIKPLPRHYIQPKTVWNDGKGRTWVCWEIWQDGSGYYIDLMEVGGPKVIEFVTRPWVEVHRAIEAGAMARAFV